MSFKRILVSFAVILLTFASLPRAGAQTADGGSGLSISPTRAEMTINPGKADNISITLKNISGIDITAKVAVNDFESNGVTGEPRVIANSKTDAPTSIKKFLVGVGDITLKKDETKRFDIPVQVPAKAVSGAYYGVIRYTAEAQRKEETEGKQVALNASLGIIVLIQVPGNITEQVQAQKIAVSRNDSNGSVFIAPPQKANISLKNTGNGFAKPFGHVAITKGGHEVYAYEMNNTDPRSNILPNGTRTFTDDIKNVTALGRYTITANISYGKGGDILTLKTSFWVIPLWALIILIVIFLLLVLGGFLLYRRIGKKRGKFRR